MLKDYFVKVSRNIMNTPYFKDASLLKAWMGLVLSVRFQPYTYDGIEVGVDEVLLTKSELSELFGTEKRRTFTILRRMERDGLITQTNIRNKYTLIKILCSDFSCCSKKKGEEGRKEKNREDESSFVYENKSCGAVMSMERVSEKESVQEEAGRPSRHEKYNIQENRTEKKIKEKPSEENMKTKSSYGEFNNVFLTRDEYASLMNQFSEAEIFISKLSAYLASNPAKKYPNHYAVILSWYNDYLLEKMGKGRDNTAFHPHRDNTASKTYRDINRAKNEDAEPDPTASYDIRRAEMLARMSVPTVKKRNRETGQWEPVRKDAGRA